MKVKQIRELTNDELTQKIKELKNELFNLRFQAATGQLDNPMRIRQVRKTIARVKTVLTEKEMESQKASGRK